MRVIDCYALLRLIERLRRCWAEEGRGEASERGWVALSRFCWSARSAASCCCTILESSRRRRTGLPALLALRPGLRRSTTLLSAFGPATSQAHTSEASIVVSADATSRWQTERARGERLGPRESARSLR